MYLAVLIQAFFRLQNYLFLNQSFQQKIRFPYCVVWCCFKYRLKATHPALRYLCFVSLNKTNLQRLVSVSDPGSLLGHGWGGH